MATSTSAATKAKTASKKAEHPPYEDMIKAAILALKERKGSSRPAIKNYIVANYSVTRGAHFDTQISAAIKRGYNKGLFALPKGPSGTVKLVKPEKKTEEKKKAAPATKKTAAPTKKTPAAKKVVKKVAATKKAAPATKKAAAPATKKAAAPAKKAAAPAKKATPTKKSTTTKANVKAPAKKAAPTTKRAAGKRGATKA
ncbi:hypothetical protein BC941DRAFT_519571 [Chlamydoabsidia padenii]|nr:hypothetical protein BC941DRAFT_519571 [Chlamydoabsidia padenii]